MLVALGHPAMRQFTRELLEREHGCWVATEAPHGAQLGRELGWRWPDLVVVDAADFPACCWAPGPGFPPARVIAVGLEPDPSYEERALADGAGAWIPRERVGEELGRVLRRLLGCVHDPCPPGNPLVEQAWSGDPGTRVPHEAVRTSTRRHADIRRAPTRKPTTQALPKRDHHPPETATLSWSAPSPSIRCTARRG